MMLPPPCVSVFLQRCLLWQHWTVHCISQVVFAMPYPDIFLFFLQDNQGGGLWLGQGWKVSVSFCLMCSKPFTTSRSSVLVLNICFLCFFPATGTFPLSFVLAMTLLETIRPATESWLEGRVSLMYMRWVLLLIPHVTFLFPASQ